MITRWLKSVLVIGILVSPPVSAKEPDDADVVASAPGRIEGASDVMSIGTGATGVIDKVLITEGDRVTKGQALVQISCKAIEAELRQREAEAAASDVALVRLKAGARDEEVAIQVAVVGVSEARATEAKNTFDRLTSLPDGVTSRAKLLESERDSKMAAAELLEARGRLRMLQAGARGEDIAEAEAKNASAAAAVDQSRARLDQCTVRAPVDGTVLTTNATPGQFVAATSASILLKMVDDRVQRVRAEVDERDLQKVCVGQHAKVAADGFKGVSLSGTVTLIDPGMGRRTVLSGDRGEKADRDVRELLVTLESEEIRWPIGLRVLVFFSKC
jgi:multidrug resistance efflux pump